jgi:uncharacterized membrane protein
MREPLPLLRLLRHKGGSVSLLFAASVFVLFGFGALAVDFGSFFYEKRRQQTANDLAAVAAASDLPRAQAAAQANARSNGFAAANVRLVQHGTYRPDPALPVEHRFTPGPASSANAVRVDMRSVTSMILGRVLMSAPRPGAAEGPAPQGQAALASGEVPIASSAIAAQDSQASFAIGSRLLKLEGGVLNGLLGGLLGGNVSLSVMDWEALAKARIDLFALSKTLATRANLNAVTFDDVLKADLRLGEVLAAIVDTARGNPTSSATAQSALLHLAQPRGNSARSVELGKLISFGPTGDRRLASPQPLAASLSALDLVSAVAQVSNGSRQVDVGLALNLPGIAAAALKLGIGERPVGSPMISVGRTGASVHTAQTRLLLTLDLVGSGQASLVRLPLYLEIAAATARIASIQCSPGDVSTSRVTLAVTPAVVDAWVGQVSMAEFNNFRTAPQPPAATLLTLAGLARVTGRAHVTMTNLAETPVSFSYPEILRGDKRTTSTQNFVASLLARLFGDLDVRVEVIGLGLGLPGLGSAVSGVISGAATPIDQLLTAVLGTLGIGLGQADSWVSGVRCGGAVLVR